MVQMRNRHMIWHVQMRGSAGDIVDSGEGPVMTRPLLFLYVWRGESWAERPSMWVRSFLPWHGPTHCHKKAGKAAQRLRVHGIHQNYHLSRYLMSGNANKSCVHSRVSCGHFNVQQLPTEASQSICKYPGKMTQESAIENPMENAQENANR